MADVNIDFIGPNGGSGEVALDLFTNSRLDAGRRRPYLALKKDGTIGSFVTTYSGGDPKKKESYRTVQVNAEAVLRQYEWRQLDAAVLPIAQSRLVGFQDLISRGLTYDLGNGMGTTVLEHHDISDAMEAEMTMDGVTRSRGDRPKFGFHYLPLPIIHVDYELNERSLETSRRMGNPLDTVDAERAARKVAEKLESMLFTVAGANAYTYGGGTIYGYLNYPYRNTITLDSKWTNSGVTGANIIEDIVAMKQKSLDDHFYGPWMLYIPSAYETHLDEDYTTGYPKTIRERIKEINGIVDVKVIDTLTADNIILVQLSSDVIRVVRGMGIQNVQWDTEGGLVHKFKVMTIQVPQLRSDQDGRCGLVHATFTA